MILRIVTSERARWEEQQRELAIEQAFRQGYRQACWEIARTLAPVADLIAECAVQDINLLGRATLLLTDQSATTLAESLARSLQELLNIAHLYLAMRAEAAKTRAEQLRLQQEIVAARQEAAEALQYKEQLAQARSRVSTVEAAKAALRRDIERLEAEIERQHLVIVDLNERLKPSRPGPQKQKSG